MSLDRIALRRLIEEDLPQILEWRNSERIRSMVYSEATITPEEHRAWFERQATVVDGGPLAFTLDGRLTGLLNLSQVDPVHRRCFIGYYIGPANAPKGIGTAMGAIGLLHAFDDMGMHRVWAEILAVNEISIRLLQRFGFRQEGLMREHAFKAGAWVDTGVFGILENEWREREVDVLKYIVEEVLPSIPYPYEP